jgi:hypothetical protein
MGYQAEALLKYIDTYGVKNKWIADVPLSVISPDFSDVIFPFTDFVIPEITIGGASTSFKGISVEVPTSITHQADRNITLSYLINEDWTNYFYLYQWANIMNKIEDLTPTDPVKTQNALPKPGIYKVLPVYAILIDVYKKPILKVTYHNAWIKHFAELSLDYQSEPAPIKHSFSLHYSHFSIEKVNKL